MKNLHLVCNAHLDPVWLWELEEGLAETLSTFRVAADFCEEYEGFVFNHNESMLYKWVEEYDPELFVRIQKLVAAGKWHIMGGWYLQPDCNMPSGESFVRQILHGKKYFMDKFGVEPRTAINFDAFGHTRGLVEIMKKAGFTSYLFCRPEPDMLELPGDDFEWEGFCGSTIRMHRAYNSYESHRGEADEKIKGWMESHKDKEVGMVLWGIGNHGGGPSRIDYQKIKELDGNTDEWNILHSTPEEYFSELERTNPKLPVYSGILNPRYTGCYTSQIRIKQLHRQLENELYRTEKMAVHAHVSGLIDYPFDKFEKAMEDLMLIEFHDILPGSSIPAVERFSMNLAGHALEELRQIRSRAFIALCSGLEKADDGTIPIIVYNPHPYDIEETIECEYQLPDQNKNKEIFANPVVRFNGVRILSQVEHEASNFNVDWRKKSVFTAVLKANSISRFDVSIEMVERKPPIKLRETDGKFMFRNEDIEVWIGKQTGTITKYSVKGHDFIKGNAFMPLVIKDDENSWAHKEKSFNDVEGKFEVMTPGEGSRFSGILDGDIESVRVIEEGPVRTIIEAVMKYNNSYICLDYHLPTKGTKIVTKVKVYWNEKMKMLKMSVPTTLENVEFIGQTAYGHEKLLANGDEMVSHKWNLITDGSKALSVINTGTYGSNCVDGDLRITMMRSPGYSAGKSDFSVRNAYIMPQDRFSPYIDQGEHDYEFAINAGDAAEIAGSVEREAMVFNERPMVLSFFPTGVGSKPEALVNIVEGEVEISAMKMSDDGKGIVFRIFNPLERKVHAKLAFPAFRQEYEMDLIGMDFKTMVIDARTNEIYEADLMERKL